MWPFQSQRKFKERMWHDDVKFAKQDDEYNVDAWAIKDIISLLERLDRHARSFSRTLERLSSRKTVICYELCRLTSSHANVDYVKADSEKGSLLGQLSSVVDKEERYMRIIYDLLQTANIKVSKIRFRVAKQYPDADKDTKMIEAGLKTTVSILLQTFKIAQSNLVIEKKFLAKWRGSTIWRMTRIIRKKEESMPGFNDELLTLIKGYQISSTNIKESFKDLPRVLEQLTATLKLFLEKCVDAEKHDLERLLVITSKLGKNLSSCARSASFGSDSSGKGAESTTRRMIDIINSSAAQREFNYGSSYYRS